MTNRYFPEDWPLPELNEFNRPFFTSGELVLQRCRGCEQIQHPPMDVCHRCQSLIFDYVATKPSGRIENVTIVHHASDVRLKALVPYNVVLVRPDEHLDLIIVGNVVAAEPSAITVGAAVVCTFARVTDPLTGEDLLLPQWELSR
jgi:uncharacterized OB-fold protein